MKKVKSFGKVIVGMSGGVDSSVALILLKKQGYEPIGVSLKYATWDDPCSGCKKRENVCCTKESFEIAKKVCQKYGVEHHILDVSKDFKKEVIDYFVRELKSNRTPSPCVFCNPNLKFKKLIEFADEVGAEFVATGHYARVKPSQVCEGLTLAKELRTAKDERKDQTYSLSFLKQDQLTRIIFPLGDLTKTEVHKIAKKEGFEFFEKRPQSQDFCFVSGESYLNFLKMEIGLKPGKIIDKDRNVLGEHHGLHFYTIGQRQGIGLAGGPYFVVGKNPKTNELVVFRNEEDSARQEVVLKPYNLISIAEKDLKKPIKVMAKTRSRQPLQRATISVKGNSLLLIFDKPLKSITPGQIAVFYFGETCLGAGVIL